MDLYVAFFAVDDLDVARPGDAQMGAMIPAPMHMGLVVRSLGISMMLVDSEPSVG